MGCWSIGVMKYWSAGVLEYRSIGCANCLIRLVTFIFYELRNKLKSQEKKDLFAYFFIRTFNTSSWIESNTPLLHHSNTPVNTPFISFQPPASSIKYPASIIQRHSSGNFLNSR